MKKIILDTNFLMIPLQFRVDIFSEINRICHFNYRLFVYRQSVNELKSIMQKQHGINKKAAQFGLKLLKLKDIEIIEDNETDVDSTILKNLDKATIVATQDMVLRKKILEKGLPVIILRKKKYLMLLEKGL